MSRLDEALRLSTDAAPSETAAGRSRVFESPWAVAPEAREKAPDVHTPEPEGVAATTSDNARLLGLPTVDLLGPAWKQWLLTAERDASIVEQFRRLAAALLHGQRDGRLKTIMVTSAVPGEGKTLTALNIALVLADSYHRRVLLIDADLRRPRLSEAADLTVAEGLGEVLKATDERKAPLRQMAERLWFLPAGRPDPDPLSGLTSPRMQQLLEEAAERFEWVIIDTPPVSAAADAGLLAAMVDATVIVSRAGVTPHPAVRNAIETIGRDRVFGVVLNGVDQQHQNPYVSYTSAE